MMTPEEINARLAEIAKEQETLFQQREAWYRNRFETLVDNVMVALYQLTEEFPNAECVLEVDTMSGSENVDILSRSDLLSMGKECFSQN